MMGIKRNKYFTIADLLLAAVFIAAAVASLWWSAAYFSGNADSGGEVTLRQNGTVIGVYPLSEDREITLKNDGYVNIVTISNGQVSMTYATCPDQYCVQHRPISTRHETIVCLPARLTAEITAGEEAELDAITQ